MTIRTRISSKGEKQLQVDLWFRRHDDVRERYKRLAAVQTMAGARAEEKRVITHFGVHGTIKALLEPEKPLPPKAAGPTWDDAVKRFKTITYKTGGRSGQGLRASTQRAYSNLLKSPAFMALEGVTLSAIDREFIVTWEAKHLSTIGASTRASYHVLLRSVLRAFLGDDGVPKFPKLPKGQHHEVEATDPAVIEAILTEVDDLDAKYLGPVRVLQRQAMRLAVSVAVTTGVRASELRAIQWRDLDLQAGTLTVRAGMIKGVREGTKSGKPRTIPLDTRILDLLTAEHSKRKPQQMDHVLVRADGKPWGDFGLATAIRKAAQRLGLKMGAPLHPIRHRFVTEVARTDPVAAQRLAGHADLSTTMRYAHSSDVRERTAVQAAMGAIRGVPSVPATPSGDTRGTREGSSEGVQGGVR